MTVIKEKVDAIVSKKGSIQVKILVLIVLLILSYFMSWKIFILFFLLLSFYVVVCCKMLEKMDTIKYNDIKDTIKTGDIVLFKTNHSYDVPEFLYYRLAPTDLSANMWSHVGLAIRCPKNILYIWEASEDPSWDYMTESSTSGTKLSNFECRVRNYNGIVAHRKILKPLNDNQIQKIYEAARITKTPFKRDLLSDNQLNCAEAINILLQQSGIQYIDKNLITPGDFSYFNGNDDIWDKEVLISF